jgi:hypothetical protein
VLIEHFLKSLRHLAMHRKRAETGGATGLSDGHPIRARSRICLSRWVFKPSSSALMHLPDVLDLVAIGATADKLGF